ncbi:MAG: hypothetical protein K6E70_02850 [Butyrivibrio sp.]|nr:hypothetical protein [Butyrivibrio sp.]
MKKVTRFLALMLAAILTGTAFHGTDASVGSVKAQGESELSPIMLSYNKGLQTFNINKRQEYWYAFDIPQDGDLKVTIVADDLTVIHFNAGETNLNYCDSVRTNYPFIKHFTATPGRYYLHVHSNYSSSFKLNIEFTGYGTKDPFKDSFDNPINYTPGSEVVGAVSYTDNTDWYKLQVPENGKYKITYRAEAGAYGLYIYDNDMKEYWSLLASITKNEPQSTTKNFKAGTYYIKASTSSWGKYRFSISRDGITPTKIKKAKSYKKGQIEVKVKGVNNVDGYEVRVCTNKNFTGKVKTKSINTGSYNKGNTLKLTLKKLKRHKNYYVQVRTFEKGSEDYYYSDWSKAKKVRVK